MKGKVNEAGRALLPLLVRASESIAPTRVSAWVDTAFDGELVIPRLSIEELGLSQSAAVQATLADGTLALLETFHCQIEWFDEWRDIEVIANEGRLPLLGVGMLIGRKLTIDYGTGTLELE